MTEAQLTKQLLVRLRRRLPQAVIIKHADRFTAGVPDFSITTGGATTWFEVKLAPGEVSRLQAETLRRLGRAWVIIFSANGQHAEITDWRGVGRDHAPRHFITELVVRLALEK